MHQVGDDFDVSLANFISVLTGAVQAPVRTFSETVLADHSPQSGRFAVGVHVSSTTFRLRWWRPRQESNLRPAD